MITQSLKGSLLLAAMISLVPAVPALAGETAEQLEAESVRYTAMAAEQEKLGKHYRLAATSGAKGGQQSRAAYHSQLASEYREQAQLHAERAQEKRDEAKRTATN
ncbi:MAG: hypothetical protein JNM50_14110 [Chromatiales bacterium]|nr:hypothetical protein [Chromatiales bacterium]